MSGHMIQSLVHSCLFFQHKKEKFIYGLTSSLFSVNFIAKYKPNYIIIPSQYFVHNVFLHSFVDIILDRLIQKTSQQTRQKSADLAMRGQKGQFFMIDKLLKTAKIVICSQKNLNIYTDLSIIKQLVDRSKVTMLHHYQIQQKSLIELMAKLQYEKVSIIYPNLKQQNSVLHDWFNGPLHELKIVVPEFGMSTIMCQGTDIIVVDPTQQLAPYLTNNSVTKRGLKLEEAGCPRLINFLHSVIITKINCVIPLLELLLIDSPKRINVLVSSKQLQKSIIFLANKYLRFPEEITRSKFLIRRINQSFQNKVIRFPVLTKCINPYNLQSPSSLTCLYYPLTEKNQPRLQLNFGSSVDIKSNKRILFFSPSSLSSSQHQPEEQLDHFPQELTQNNVELVVLYRVNEELMKQLKALPQILRKKIILNRNEHKYNHKYFVTFEKGKIQYCSITDIQFLNLTTKAKQDPQSLTLKGVYDILNTKQVIAKDTAKWVKLLSTGISRGMKIYEISNNREMDTVGHVLQVVDGLILCFFQSGETRIIGGSEWKNVRIQNAKKIRALKYAQIKILMKCDDQVISNFQKINRDMLNEQIKKNNLTQKSESASHGTDKLRSIKNNSLINMMNSQQRQKLNSVCHPVAYEVGNKINNNNENVYFISKGGMKWEDTDQIAGNDYFIGDLISFYEGSFENYIEVVKDTWALEVNTEEFHSLFLMQYPHFLHQIFKKGKFFI